MPVQVLSECFSKSSPSRTKIKPNQQSLVFQLVPIASCSGTKHHWKEPGSIFFAPALQLFIDIDEATPEPPLDSFQYAHISQSGGLRTGHSVQDATSLMLSRGKASHLLTWIPKEKLKQKIKITRTYHQWSKKKKKKVDNL